MMSSTAGKGARNDAAASSRPTSRNKSPNPAGGGVIQAPGTAALPEEPGSDDTAFAQNITSKEVVPVPTQTIYMQVVEFLLEVKAMPVKAISTACTHFNVV